MRVTNSAIMRNFTSSINDVHSKLNKSMNKVSSGKAYESAAENPLAYYEGQKIDHQYQDTLSKLSLTTSIKNRLYQQELGVRSIQGTLSNAKTQIEYIRSDSNNGDMKTINTIKEDLLQKMQSMVNDLNGQYQNYYVFGGNNSTTPPFSLSADGMTLTFSHQFAGDDETTEMVMTLEQGNDGSYQYVYGKKVDLGGGTMGYPPAPADGNPDQTMDNILRAMKEQGRVDIGYGNISDRDTLLDTFTGGLNLMTGLSSDALRTMSDSDARAMVQERMNQSPLGLIGQAVDTMNKYADEDIDKSQFSSVLGSVMDQMTATEHNVSTVYSDLGNKYSLVESTETRLDSMKDSLEEQYNDKLGADPYEAIIEVNYYQYAYTATQKAASYMMQSSLFDFMR